MKPKKAREMTVEELYPSSNARAKAWAMFDKLPLTVTIGEAIRLWELEYLNAGGRVNVPACMRGG